jgi:hypothetical protein
MVKASIQAPILGEIQEPAIDPAASHLERHPAPAAKKLK